MSRVGQFHGSGVLFVQRQSAEEMLWSKSGDVYPPPATSSLFYFLAYFPESKAPQFMAMAAGGVCP